MDVLIFLGRFIHTEQNGEYNQSNDKINNIILANCITLYFIRYSYILIYRVIVVFNIVGKSKQYDRSPPFVLISPKFYINTLYLKLSLVS